MSLYLLLDVFIAYVIDLIVGDPGWLPHPVRFIGWLIKNTEKVTRKLISVFSTKKLTAMGDDYTHTIRKAGKTEKVVGVFFAIFVVSVVYAVVLLISNLCSLVHPLLFHAVNVYFIYSAFAARCLADESYKIFEALRERDIFKARIMLSMIVGRQTENLDEKEIVKGAVESIAENTVDGVVSPIFYAVLGSVFALGAPVVYAFKAISTLDSMVGYKNEEYINLGWASAKLDDIVNFIPARFTALLIATASFLTGKNAKGCFRIMLRDGKKHNSPNSGYPEAAIAGALGIELGGAASYSGKIVEKPFIGDNTREIGMKDISYTITIMIVTSIIAMVVMGLIFLLIYAVLAKSMFY
jgi:adenosylcobinamide-phosphate synthase